MPVPLRPVDLGQGSGRGLGGIGRHQSGLESGKAASFSAAGQVRCVGDVVGQADEAVER